MFNTRRRHSRRGSRNPVSAITKPFEALTGGVPLIEIAAGAGSLAAVAILPGMIVKDTSKMTGKLFKVVIAIGTAIGMSYAAKSLGSGVQKAALIGGLSGVGVIGINMVRPGTIPGIGSGPIMLGSGSIGEGVLVSPAVSRGEEHVGVILP